MKLTTRLDDEWTAFPPESERQQINVPQCPISYFQFLISEICTKRFRGNTFSFFIQKLFNNIAFLYMFVNKFSPDNSRQIDRFYFIFSLIGQSNVDGLYFFMNFSKVEEIKKHEDDPGEREEDPRLSINQHSKFVVFLPL